MESSGEIKITKETGLFECISQKPIFPGYPKNRLEILENPFDSFPKH